MLFSGKKELYQVILKKIELPVVERRECEKALRTTRLGSYFKLHASFICAGGEEGKDTCTVGTKLTHPLIYLICGMKQENHAFTETLLHYYFFTLQKEENLQFFLIYAYFVFVADKKLCAIIIVCRKTKFKHFYIYFSFSKQGINLAYFFSFREIYIFFHNFFFLSKNETLHLYFLFTKKRKIPDLCLFFFFILYYSSRKIHSFVYLFIFS